jgi:transposase
VDTYGQRKTAHVFAAISLDEARWFYRFASVFNGHTFLDFLKQLVARHDGRKIFLIIDNAPYHWLKEDGKKWLKKNKKFIELYRLPPYSPEFNPVEGVWKITRKMTTHNRFFQTTKERDPALRKTFTQFQQRPSILFNQVVRFQ